MYLLCRTGTLCVPISKNCTSRTSKCWYGQKNIWVVHVSTQVEYSCTRGSTQLGVCFKCNTRQKNMSHHHNSRSLVLTSFKSKSHEVVMHEIKEDHLEWKRFIAYNLRNISIYKKYKPDISLHQNSMRSFSVLIIKWTIINKVYQEYFLKMNKAQF